MTVNEWGKRNWGALFVAAVGLAVIGLTIQVTRAGAAGQAWPPIEPQPHYQGAHQPTGVGPAGPAVFRPSGWVWLD